MSWLTVPRCGAVPLRSRGPRGGGASCRSRRVGGRCRANARHRPTDFRGRQQSPLLPAPCLGPVVGDETGESGDEPRVLMWVAPGWLSEPEDLWPGSGVVGDQPSRAASSYSETRSGAGQLRWRAPRQAACAGGAWSAFGPNRAQRTGANRDLLLCSTATNRSRRASRRAPDPSYHTRWRPLLLYRTQ
jgi:hypothetical protein